MSDSPSPSIGLEGKMSPDSIYHSPVREHIVDTVADSSFLFETDIER